MDKKHIFEDNAAANIVKIKKAKKNGPIIVKVCSNALPTYINSTLYVDCSFQMAFEMVTTEPLFCFIAGPFCAGHFAAARVSRVDAATI